MKKVLILSCGTGGGHNSAALAIQEAFIEKGLQADFIEYLSIINPKVKNGINHLYIQSTNGNGKVFKVVYRLGELYQKTRLKSPVYQLNRMNKKKLYEYITSHGYDYVITTHLFAAQALTAIKKEHPISFLAVATDYVCIPFWEETEPDYFIIPSEELSKDFEEKGIPKEKLLPWGIPVAKTYRQEYKKEDCQKELGLEQEKKHILILTGSMGFGNVGEMVQTLLEQVKMTHFIVSCGNNEKLYKNLQETYQGNPWITVLPFTKQISQYMKSSDIILSKPGGLTTTEIATLHKPMIHTMPIPGCENYNASFFEKKKMSMQCHSVEEVIDCVKTLLENPTLQEEMIQKQKEQMDTRTCENIVELVQKEDKKGEVQ